MAERFLIENTKKVVFKKEGIKALSDILKSYAAGEKVLVISSNVYLKENLIELENQFKISNNEFEYLMQENLNSINNLSLIKKISKQIGEDVGLIVAVGGDEIVNLVKAVSYIKNINFVLVCNEAAMVNYFENKVEMLVDFKPVVFKCRVPLALIVDKNNLKKMPRKKIAALFSEITSKESFVLENYLINITKKNVLNKKALKNISALIEGAMNIADGLEDDLNKNSVNALTRSAINMGLELQKNNLIYNSSDSSVCKALCYLQEDYSSILSYKIVASVFLMDLFEKFIKNLNFYNYACFSRKIREEKIKQIAGVQERAVVSSEVSYDHSKRKLFVYAVEEFREDLLAKIENSKERILKCFKIFKRLDIEGFYLLDKKIDAKNIKDAICVSPDMYNFNNFLSILKDFGVLDYNF